jgi:uncharacterized protein YhaN
MTLKRIEAERFGEIGGSTLGELGAGLTVVLGSNEAGKSSFAALTRYVLYGYPGRGEGSEPPYLSAAGKRLGRLVFGDETGEWVVERTEGTYGGPVVVHTVSGRERPDLPKEITRGVSRLAYRVVFGFGLDEMQQIEKLKGKDDDLLSRLYAAGAGLAVSPPDIRAGLEEQADALWKKGGSIPPINRAKTERDEVRKEIRRVEAEADAFRQDRERLTALELELEAARRERVTSQARAESLGRAVAEARRLTAEAEAHEDAATASDDEAAGQRAVAESMDVDVDVLAAGDRADALCAEAPAQRQRLDALRSQEARLAQVEGRVRQILVDAGWDEDIALQAASDVGTATGIESARDEIAALKTRADMATAERDRLLGEMASATAPMASEAGGTRPWMVPGGVGAGIGLAAVVTGIALGQVALSVFGALLVLAGVVVALLPRTVTGTGGGSQGDSAARLRAAESQLVSAAEARDRYLTQWSSWVVGHGLGHGSEDPAAIAARLSAAREARTLVDERDMLRVAIGEARALIDAYVQRVRDLVAAVGEDPGAVAADTADGTVAGVAALVAAERGCDAERRAVATRLADVEKWASAEREAAANARSRAFEQLEEAGVHEHSLDAAGTAETEARLLAEDALKAYDGLASEAAALHARIDTAGREDALARSHLQEATLDERIATHAREYVVFSLAAKLLATTQERYERDRQPAVVQSAEAAFSTMTGGRYTRVTIPLGKESIEVFDASAAAKLPSLLSRGTAEQLYLALRLGLIEQLGEVGAELPVIMDDILVNFSPDRLTPAAAAIADLASRRQVVFFTCHPGMARVLADASAGSVSLTI